MRKKLAFVLISLFVVSCLCTPTDTTPTEIKPTLTVEQKQPEPTKEVIRVVFICEECVDEDGSILPIKLWKTPDELGDVGYVLHRETCLLLDETISSENIEKVLLQCPNGTGWTRKDAIN